MEDEQASVIAFRVGQLERALETQISQINTKLDQLISLQNENQTKAALDKAAREVLTERVTRIEVQISQELKQLERTMEELKQDSTNLRITTAEKFGPGAIAGTVASAVLTVAALIAKFFVGG